MATASTESKSKSAKYDAYVVEQLDKAQKRIRNLDLISALCVLVAGTLSYALLVSLMDHWARLSTAVLITFFLAYLVGAGLFVAFAIVRPLMRSINPYYAARRMEGTVETSKNSVVNWLDLQGEPLPSAIQGAVGQRAAKDLAKANLDEAFSSRRAGWAGASVGMLLGAMFVLLLIFGGPKFFSHLARAFAPFQGQAVANQTRIAILFPEGGNGTVPINRDVTILARIEGRVPEEDEPDAPQLWFRSTAEDPYYKRPLEYESFASQWRGLVRAEEVRSGFLYRIVAGDASTPEYRITVRANPLIVENRFLATFERRKYRGKPLTRAQVRKDSTMSHRRLEDYQGTEVTLQVPTNRKLKSGFLAFYGKDGSQARIPATIDPEKPQEMQIKLTLEKSGTYRLGFLSVDEESYVDVGSYPITAQQDRAPKVVLNKPGKDLNLPANGLLKLEGTIHDDIGIQSATLRMKVLDGPVLKAKPYRNGKKLALGEVGLPHVLDYNDFVDLAKVETEKGEPLALQPGQVVEYYLEAADACDYPKANVGKSPTFKVTIAEPEEDREQQKQDREQAQREQQDHQQKQDDKLQEEQEKREQQAKEQQKQNDQAKGKAEKDPSKKEKKPDQGKGEKKPDQKGGEGKPDKGSEKSPEQKKKEEQDRKNAEKLKDAMDKMKKEKEKKEKEKGEKGEGKGDPQSEKGKGKEGSKSEGKDGGKKGDSEQQEGKGKGEQKPKENGSQSKGKEGAKKGEPNPDQAKGKKDSGGMGSDDKSSAKDKPKDAGKQESAAKDGPKEGEQKETTAQSKEGKEGSQKGEQAAKKGETKEGNKNGESAAQGRKDGDQNPDKQQSAAKEKGGEKGEEKSQAQAKGNPNEEKGKGTEGQKKQANGKGAGKEGQPQQTASKEKGGDSSPGQKQSAGKEKGKSGTEQARSNGKGEKPSSPEKGSGKSGGEKKEVANGEGKGDPKKGEGNPQGSSGDRKASAKGDKEGSGGGEGEKRSVAKDDKSGKGQGQGMEREDIENATKEDVERLAEDLKSDDPQKRERAARDLEKIREQANNEEARQNAEESLNKAGQGQKKDQVASSKGSPKKGGGNKGEKPSAGGQKPGPGQTAKKPGTGKQPGTEQSVAKGQPKGSKPGEKGQPGTGEGKQSAKGKGKPGGQNNDPQGTGGTNPTEVARDGSKGDGSPIDPGDREKSNVMQYRNLSEVQKEQIRKQTGLSDQEIKQAIQYVEKEGRTGGKGGPVDISKGGSRLTTTGPDRVKVGGGPSSGADPTGTLVLPPEYRDPYRQLSRDPGKP